MPEPHTPEQPRISGRLFIVLSLVFGFFLYLAIPLSVLVDTASPAVTTFLFFAGLIAWYLPGMALSWTGLLRLEEFGAVPVGSAGYFLGGLFWMGVVAAIALLVGKFRRSGATDSP